MERITSLDPHRQELGKYVEGMAAAMGESAMCISIFTQNYKEGIDSLLQFAVAIMMNKPIWLMVPEGVKRVADGWEFFKPGDKNSFETATKNLLMRSGIKDLSA